MTIRDFIHETSTALRANKIRSGLTMLGIVIGISSVIAMVSIGQGAQKSIESSIQSIGSNLLMIQPGAQRGPGSQISTGRGSTKTLTLEDAIAVQNETENIIAVAPEVSSRYQVVASGNNTNTSIVGTTEAYLTVRNISVDNGSFISESDVQSGSRIAILGPTVKTDLFGEEIDPIGETVRINGTSFTVIGVTVVKGGTGFGSQDDMIFVPISTAQRYFTGDAYVSSINVQTEPDADATIIQSSITELLRARHRIAEGETADFNILNQADIISAASSVTQIFTILLGSVAGISLVVGGIGIMNMMLTSVTERTREIGLRKAIGARKRDISLQFLIEAIALTFIGGMIGILLGIIISFGITATGLLTTDITSGSILLAFGVSAGIGIIFGYYPARRAAKLNPIEALRYE